MLKDKLTITYNLDEVADSLGEGVRFLKEHGIDSAEVRTINNKNIAKLTLEETVELKNTLRAHGLTVSAIASPLFKWYSENQVNESKADLFGMNPCLSKKEKKILIQKIIDQAEILETTKVRVFSGLKLNPKDHTLPDEESELLIYALKIATERGVQLLLENEPVCHISKIEDYIDMFTSGKYTGLRAWLDIANIYEEGETLSRSHLKILAPFIDYLHIKDPIAPNAHKYVSLGEGYINYKKIFDSFEEVIKNSLHLSIETHVKDNKSIASHTSLCYLHKLLDKKRTRYALVGTGRISQKHLDSLKENENCTLIGVYDTDIKKSQSTALIYDCTNYDSYESLLADDFVDVVSICTPHGSHIDLASQAIKSGKKVLCEKPLALNLAQLQHYISKTDTIDNTHVIFQNKFNSAVKKFYEFEKEKLGEPQYIAVTLRWWRDVNYYKDWHGSQEISGGALITQAIHSLELVTHLTNGTGIRSVKTTQLKTRSDITLPDIITSIVEFKNGVVCNIEVCLATRECNLESSIFVVGTKGSIKISGTALSELVHPKTEQTEDMSSKHYYGGGHAALYRAHSNKCLHVIDPDISLLTTPTDLKPILTLIEKINEAAQ